MTTINTQDIKKHANVIDSQGTHVGTVDHLEGADQIKLTRHDATDGKHHLIPVSWVKEIKGDDIVLSKSAEDVKQGWKAV